MLDIDPRLDDEQRQFELEQEEMGEDPFWVKWLIEVERQLDTDLGVDRADS